jgi:hypothetical protein
VLRWPALATTGPSTAIHTHPPTIAATPPHTHAGNHGKKIAVVENEFGEVCGWCGCVGWCSGQRQAPTGSSVARCVCQVGIDDALVLESKEEIFELNNGCVCCTGGAWCSLWPA